MMAETAPMGEVYLNDLAPSLRDAERFLGVACVLQLVEDPRSSARALARAVDAVEPLARRVQLVALAASGRVPSDTAHAVALLGFTRIARLARDFARQDLGGVTPAPRPSPRGRWTPSASRTARRLRLIALPG